MRSRSLLKFALFFALVTLVCQLTVVFPLPIQEANAPDPDFADAIWVGRTGGVVKVATEDGAVLFEVADGFQARVVAVDELAGRVWIFGGGVLRAVDFDGQTLWSMPLAEDSDGAAYLVARGGAGWLGVDDVLFHFDEGGGLLLTLPLESSLRGLALDPANGQVRAATRTGIFTFDTTGTQVDVLPLSDPAGAQAIALSSQDGALWVALQKRLRRYGPDGSLQLELDVRKVEHLAADGAGGVWAATNQNLLRFDSGGQELVAQTLLGVPGNSVALSVNTADGSAWLATQQHLVQVSGDGQILLEVEFHGGGGPPGSTLDMALYTDRVAPQLVIVSPTDGDVVRDPRLRIELSFSDIGQGVDGGSLRVTRDAVVLATTCAVLPGSAACVLDNELPEGEITLAATVADFVGNLSDPAEVTFEVVPPNRSPELVPISDRTVDLGSSLELRIEAVDLDDDPLSFSASPLPLPSGAILNTNSGFFTFVPGEDEVGEFTLDFTVSDGIEEDSERITITVRDAPSGAPTAISGRLLDTNAFVNGIEMPIVGATVSIAGETAISGPDGRFLISGITAGVQLLFIDSISANPAPDGAPYTSFAEAIELTPGVTNVIGRPFFLPRIDASSLTMVNPAATTTITNPNLGVSVIIPPGTARLPDGSFFLGEMSISEVPASLAPVALPEALEPALLVTLQPVGVSFTTPVMVTMPNLDGMPPGSELDLWSVDPQTGQFGIVGVGRVSGDGSLIEVSSGGIRSASWHAFLAPEPDPDDRDNNPENLDPDKCFYCSSGSRTAPLSGNLSINHDLPAYTSLDQLRGLRLVYNSETADPRPVVVSRAKISRRAAVPFQLSAGIQLGGLDLGPQIFTDTSGLNEELDEILRKAIQVDASSLATGSYSYRMKLTSRYSISAISSFQQGQVLVHNLAKSPVGAGWGIAGLERLHPQPDGSMVLTDGNGAILRFQAAPILENGLEARMFNTNDPVGAVGSGFAGLTSRRFQVTTASGTRFTDRFNFPVINFPDGDFDTSAFYNVGANGFVDAGSGETSPQGDDISIQPPGGNETFGVQFSGFLFLPYGGDVVFTVGVDDTFDLIVNGESVAQFLGGTDFQNFSGTARNLPSGFVPILLNYGDIAFEANLVLQASGGGLPGGVVPSSFLFAAPEGGGPPDEFLAPAGDFSTLQSNQDGTFTRIFKDGTAHHFEASGLQTAMVDAADNATNYSYDSAGRLTTTTDPMGLVTTLSYGAEHLASVTDFAGRVTELEHDADGNLTRITDADGSIREFEFDARHRLVLQRSKRGFDTLYEYNFAGQNVRAVRPDGSLRDIFPQNAVGLFDPASGVGQSAASPAPVLRPEEATALFVDGNGNGTTFNIGRFGSIESRVDPLGRLTTIARDADGLPVRNVEANGTVTEWVYDDRGNLLALRRTTATALELRYEPRFNQVTQITDEAGHQTFFEYDDQGNRTRTTDSLGNMATATFDSQGLVQTRTDENGNLTTFTYDAVGNLKTLTDPLGIVTRFTRDVVGNVTAITEGLGTPEERTSTLTYDVLDRVRSETDPTGGLLRGVYDPAGNLVEAIGPGGELTRLSYDASDRLVGLDDPLSGSTSLVRDDNGNLVELIDSLGRTTVLAYDAADQLIAMTDALGKSQEKTYDALGNVLTLEDARGGVTHFTYDFLGRLIQQVSPLGRTTLFAYDVRDNLVEVTDPSGQAIQLSFDALSRPVRVVTPDNLIEATYDAVGNLLTITDDDSALEFVYDANNRAVSEATYDVGVQPAVTVTSGFNAVENRVTLSDSLGGTARYTFDSSDRLTELITAAGDALQMSSDASGRETGIVFPNGVTTHRAYDPRGRLTSLAHTLASADLARFSYGYDALSNIVSIDEIGRTLAFTYDGLGRLTAAGSPLAPENYSYDPEGNRDASHLSALHIHDVDNQLLEDAAFTYAYHPSGNLASKTEKASGGVTTYAYDALHQLVRVDPPDGVVAKYRYDALGRRSEKSVDGVITRYVYNREDIVLEFDGSNTLTARYSHGGDIDQPLSQQRDGQSYFYHADHQGSIRQITDSSGQVVNAYEYDAYGQITSSVEGIVNPYTYTGREQDAESGLLYYRLRTYDPHTGRFLQRDPIGFEAGDTNLYRYVFSDPVNLVDPSGLGALGAAIGGTAGAIIGGVIGGTAGGTGGGLVGAFAGPPGAVGGVALGGSEGAALGAAAGLTVGAILGSVIEDALDNVVFSKGGKSRRGDGLRRPSDEEIYKGARAKARTKAEKAERQKFRKEEKIREERNKQKRANKNRNSGKKKKKNRADNCK